MRRVTSLYVVSFPFLIACSSASDPAPAQGDAGLATDAGAQAPADAGTPGDAGTLVDGALSNGPPSNGTTCAEAASHFYSVPCADETFTESQWLASCNAGQTQCAADGLGAEFQSLLGCIARSSVTCIPGYGLSVACTGLPTANCFHR
jgi:hypothetical protein